MLGSTKFAIGCAITWGVATVAGQLIAPGESKFYGLAEGEQQRLQLILAGLRIISIGAFVMGSAAMFLTFLNRKERKQHEEYLRNNPEAAAAAEFTFHDDEDDDLEEMSDEQLLAEETPTEQLPNPQQTDEPNSPVSDDDKAQKVNAD